MTEREIRQALAEAVEAALDKMFFIPGPGEPQPDGPPPECVTARLRFIGEPSGRLTLKAPAAGFRSIAADFLGLDEAEISESQEADVIRELANMICGAMLSRLEAEQTFRLDTPEIAASADACVETEGVAYSVETGSGALEVIVELEADVCPPVEKSAF